MTKSVTRRSFPGPHVLELAARRQIGIRRKLGRGTTRTSYLTRSGEVLKLPLDRHGEDCNAREVRKYERGTAGIPVARCRIVLLLGIKCVLMEYVDLRFGFSDGDQSNPETSDWLKACESLPEPHVRAFTYLQHLRHMFPYGLRSSDTFADCFQIGLTPDNRAVIYDAG